MADEQPDKPSKLSDPSGWVEAHGRALYAYAWMRLHDADAAEDAVQESLLAAIKGRDRFDGRSSERTWLIGILRHKVLDTLRARGRSPDSIETTEPEVFAKGRWIEHQHEWDERMDDEELLSRLLTYIDRLPDKMRLALLLREIDGLPGSTVCEILGVSSTNLWTLVHRAKLRLRKELGDSLDSEDADP